MSDAPIFTHKKEFAAAATAAAAVMAFATSPLIRFADPIWLIGSGYAIALGLWLFWPSANDALPKKLGTFGLLLINVGVGGLVGATIGVLDAALINDERCEAIQNHMLADDTKRADDAAMMQALGCRPQGNEMPSYVPVLPYDVGKPPVPKLP
jgi:hypothetical protein